MTTYLSGAALGLTLIMAIGAQNAFVLRQGLRRSHVFVVCLACAASDAALIAAGVAGFGRLVEAAPAVVPAMTWGGAAFLTVYGAFAFRSALNGGDRLEAAAAGPEAPGRTLAICLALTWLNPHVYLDTVVLLGSVAAASPDRWAFGAGAMTASFAFFFALGYGARMLAPLFERPVAWRVLDAVVGVVMWGLALMLVLG